MSLKMSTLESQRSQEKCIYILSFRRLFTVVIHVQGFSHAKLAIQATLKNLYNSERHKTSYRKLGEKRGVLGEVHKMMAPFPVWKRVEMDTQGNPATLTSAIPSYRQRLKFTRSFGPSRVFPIDK